MRAGGQARQTYQDLLSYVGYSYFSLHTQSLLVTRVIHVRPFILRLNTYFYSSRRVVFR